MELQAADQIIARIDEATRQHPGGVLAFDGDGTLWEGDVGEDFFHALLARGDFREPARAQMARDATEHGLAAGGTGKDLAARLYHDYLAGRFPEERICELMTWACADWTESEVDAFAGEVLARIGLEARLHREVRRVLLWAEAQRIDTFLVSASPRAIIDHAARFLGLVPGNVIAAQPRYEGGRMLPEVHRPSRTGLEKYSTCGRRSVAPARSTPRSATMPSTLRSCRKRSSPSPSARSRACASGRAR